MERLVVFAFLLLLLKNKVTYATMWLTQRYTDKDVYLQGFTIESSKVERIFACYRKCENNKYCSSINMMLTDKTCELKYSTKSRHPENKINRTNTIYMEIRHENADEGSRPDIPTLSCKKLKENDSHAKSGAYWMKFNEPSSEPFQVFCDMTIDGGGWTLVYSYTFTHFNDFDLKRNDVSPIPTWPLDKATGTWVPESMTIPLSESSHSAMDFALWKKIGNDFLIKPNITNWVACVEVTGSLVNWKEGSVTCRVVKAITSTCAAVTPNMFVIKPECGPALFLNTQHYIFLEGNGDRCKAYHDPCGTKSIVNHLTNVSSPGGALYVR